MSEFASVREAKEFLVARIVQEAQAQGVPLSEVERKMLYFTESGWTLPDIGEVNEAFDRDYDQASYEAKIAKIIRQIRTDDRKRSPQQFEAWKDAVKMLRKEDHYLLVMIDEADSRAFRVIATIGCCVGLAVLGVAAKRC